jgi:ATPase subunit of ABC transporter with duplicated ATPase domains
MEQRMAYLKQKSKNPGFATLLRVQEAKFKREFIGSEPEKVKFTKQAHLHLEGGVHNSKRLMRYENKDITIVGKLLIKACSFEMWGKERILLQGANGTGKTTLLRDILAQFQKNDDPKITIGNGLKYCYVDQYQLNINADLSVLDEFLSKVEGAYRDQLKAKKMLSSFGLGELTWNQSVSTLSYGQKVRLRFAEIA